MKILLDENLPLKLKEDFGTSHEVWSVREMRWSGKRNGELLDLIAQEEFNAFVTMDKNLPNQQNLTGLPFVIFLLCGINNKLETLRDLIPIVLKEINSGLNVGIIRINK